VSDAHPPTGGSRDAGSSPLASYPLLMERCKRFEAACLAGERRSTEGVLASLDESQQQFTETHSLINSNTAAKQVGRYRLLRLLGEGGFGRVHLGFDEELQRQVAIKIPTPDRFQNPGDAELYLSEARTAATLDHPNIVPVYDVGRTADSSVYVVSKFIEGPTLGDRIEERPGADEAVRLVATIALALDHAHRKRLIHRDVKPANILIEKESGTPYLADFGLAIREEDYLRENKVAGTPAYMSPEQVRGEGHRLDGRSDIFSLGVVFYELLTGKKPFRGSTTYELLHQVIAVDPPPPRDLDDSVFPELERICLKALSKRASDRYATATELADDLVHWQHGPQQNHKQATIVPRGLRSFGPDDADFFLDLLPGTRGRDGLPESIRFWKTRIEETDPEKTFDVGLIYGPSGCGKSSLVRAGLLPHLSRSVVAIDIEATPDETETRILRRLRKRLPELPDDLGLVETFTLLRRGRGYCDGRKIVVVMDQFEQWLHARRAEQESELVNALRQCDGGKLQAIVMVRDDFSMAASRFMRMLETRIIEGHNFATVDLFDVGHAVTVLTKFGQAFGKLPAHSVNLSDDQNEFIRSVASGLAQDGKVVSVRLALFAEMVKGQPWIPTTLEEVGGTDGIGINFLEETFSGRKANPEYRLHQQAAREVLKALLPEVGTDIKGHMRSHAELLVASGYHNCPRDFNDLLRMMDGALRLITPTDPEGPRTDSGSDPGSKYYQLTHDYLVPSLREWLTRKQKETRQGRTELRLAELAALWNAKPENRRLPGWKDYWSIRRFTNRRDWTNAQRRMMREAARYHAQSLVRRLLEVDLVDVPKIVGHVRQLRKWTEPLMRQKQQAAADQSQAKLHTSLALLAVDQSQLNYLYERLLQSTSGDFTTLRDMLAEHREELSGRLWSDAQSAESEERRLRAAAALAAYEPANPGWHVIRDDVVQSLTRVKPEFLGSWKEALRPVRAELLSPLGSVFRNHKLGELQQALATSALADYAADDVQLLADLIKDARAWQFAELFPVLARHGEKAISELEYELETASRPLSLDTPPDAGWRDVGDDVRYAIEAAAGMVEERFILCQTIPYLQFCDVVEQLRGCGYRPLRIRPYLVGFSVLVAAVWTRDGRSWQWLGAADVERLSTRDTDLRREGYVPIDVSASFWGDGLPPRYTAVWEQANVADTEVRLIVGQFREHEQQRLTALVEERFNCQTANVVFDRKGQLYGFSLWTRRKHQQKSTTRWFHDLAAHFLEDDCPGLVLTDSQLSWSEEKQDGKRVSSMLTTALWNVSTKFESKVLHGLSITEQRLLGPQLTADGFRPVAISVAHGADGGLPVATSVWHRPLVLEEAKDRLAKRQANAAVALLRLDREQKVWPMLQHRPDPRARSYLIHQLGPLGADPSQVLTQLDRQNNVSIRRAMILTLGEFSEQQLQPAERERTIPRLLDLYANDSDSGIHGAVAWTLRRWGCHAALQKIDREFATGSLLGNRRWFVNRQGKTLVIIPPPGDFVIGSPPTEVGREGGPEGGVEMQRHVRIDYPFAVMSHQVTVGEFLEFRKGFFYRKYFSPESDCPINNVAWYDAVAYCNWLNEREDIPQDQWCYQPNDQGEYAQGMRIVGDCLRRTGYRLPTEEEWEFACRAGSTTSRYYGQNIDLDNHYTWSVQNSLGRRTALVGSLKPNDFGLFDMLGNTLDWCHNPFHDHSSPTAPEPGGDRAKSELVSDQQMRALRSPTLAHCPETVRAAFFDLYAPNAMVYGVGLRVSRTYMPDQDLSAGSEVRNAQRQVLRGSTAIDPSEGNRSGLRCRFSPNFGLFALGFRAARTVN
jgi:serine/threonine protein kinase/formylglycine-generating enzyme required for sulfatase activity